MTRFLIRKLPPHWRFVPSQRRVRDWLAQLGADVRFVEYEGTGRKSAERWVSLGFLESRVVDGYWCFYLRFWGIQEKRVKPLLKELSETALGTIARYIRDCLNRQAAETTKPEQLLLVFRVEDGKIHSACWVKLKDRYSFPTGNWWQEP
jgi:hypothetical protein